MNRELVAAQSLEIASRNVARRILVFAALISTVFGALYFLGLMGKLIVNGTIHAESSPAISMISAAVGLLWDATLVVLYVALRRQITGSKAVFAGGVLLS